MSQYEKLDAGERRLMNEAFQPSSDLFEPITVHSKSDWITSHPEDPQDFEQFFTDHNRKAPCPEKHIIYMQSIGVGIFSFARYGKDFYSSRYEGKVKKAQRTSSSDYSIFDNYYNPEVTSILLRRSCKTLTHEIGHIFGLRHCQWLACLMQGSNHLEESDRRPLHLCPICLRKLQCAIGFSIVERYKALLRWIDDESNDTSGAAPKNSSDQVNLKKPVEAFKDWREWIIKCIAVLEK